MSWETRIRRALQVLPNSSFFDIILDSILCQFRVTTVLGSILDIILEPLFGGPLELMSESNGQMGPQFWDSIWEPFFIKT